MYWNAFPQNLRLLLRCWIVTLDVLKCWWNYWRMESNGLNSNIRCIEMVLSHTWASQSRSWIVTLDVLKYANFGNDDIWGTLNSNIRCIEIMVTSICREFGVKLNSNIRCIEIKNSSANGYTVAELNSNIRCIEIPYPCWNNSL